MTEIGSGQGGLGNSQQIIDAVHRRFSVAREYLRQDEVVEFSLEPFDKRESKSNFLSLLSELSTFGFTAVLRRTDQGHLLMVFRKPTPQKQNLKWPMVLFLATIVAVIADGFIRASSYTDPLTRNLSFSQALGFSVIYAVALLGILGVHEMGHKVASWHHKMNSSWPYFIPGIPSVLPTFGAVIRAADPPPNRDALFDLGISGPVAGLVIAVIVSIVAAGTAHLIPSSLYPAGTAFSSVDYYTSFLLGVFKPASASQVVGGPLFNLLYFAYSFGFFVTFINLLPAWQLDGGHVANSAVSPKVHRALTYASAILMIVIGLYLMGFLVLILSGRAPSLRPLDDVSPLSNKRKVFFVLTWVLAGLIGAFIVLNNPVFSLGLIFK